MFYHLLTLSAVTLTAYCQYAPSSQLSSAPRFSSSLSPSSQLGSIPQYSSPQYSSSQFSSNQYLTTPSPKPNYPPAQIHYVNIGADLAGDYKFGYDTGKGPTGQSFREETRLPDGTVQGAYGYVDANGQQRVVKYTAGKEGFKVEGNPEAGAAAAAPPSIPQLQSTYSAPASQPAPIQTLSQPSVQPYRGATAQVYRVPTQTQAYRPAAPAQVYRSVAPAQVYREAPRVIEVPVQSQYQSPPPQVSSVYSQPLPQVSQPAPQRPIYRSQSAIPASFGIATTPKPEQETWGPPVINTELLSYNIGAQQG